MCLGHYMDFLENNVFEYVRMEHGLEQGLVWKWFDVNHNGAIDMIKGELDAFRDEVAKGGHDEKPDVEFLSWLSYRLLFDFNVMYATHEATFEEAVNLYLIDKVHDRVALEIGSQNNSKGIIPNVVAELLSAFFDNIDEDLSEYAQDMFDDKLLAKALKEYINNPENGSIDTDSEVYKSILLSC